MTDDQWKFVCFTLEQGWRGEFDEETRAAYQLFLGDFERDEVIGALKTLAWRGMPYFPKPADILPIIEESRRPAAPDWTTAWDAIRKSMRFRKADAGLGYLAGVHPVLEAFVRREGFRELQIAPFFEEPWGHRRVDELGDRYAKFVGQARASSTLGLSGMTQPAVEAADQHALPEGDSKS